MVPLWGHLLAVGLLLAAVFVLAVQRDRARFEVSDLRAELGGHRTWITTGPPGGRRPLRCRLGGHRWVKVRSDGGWREKWHCTRCPAAPPVCRNCGGVHDPTALLVVCGVTR